MNVSDIKNAVTQKFGMTGLQIQKHSPEILLGVGLIGMAATVVMASRATLKLESIVSETRQALETIDDTAEQANKTGNVPAKNIDEITLKAKTQVYVVSGLEVVKLYGPSFALGVASIAAILASHGVMKNRQVALVAAYNVLAEGYKNYRARVVEELGEEKDLAYHLGLAEETVTETVADVETGKKSKVKKTRYTKLNELSGYARLYDNSSTQWRDDRMLARAFLMGQQRHANDLLMLNGFVFLNQVYDMLGFPWTKEGQMVGWVLKNPEQMKKEGRDGFISFGLENPINEADRQFMDGHNDAIWLDFNVDGIVLDLF